MSGPFNRKDDAELRPLRSGPTSPEDRLLAQGLSGLFPDAAPAPMPEEGWDRLEAEALQIARRQRRVYLLRELLQGALPRSWSQPRALFALAAAALLLLVPLLGGRLRDRGRPAPPVELARATAPQLRLSATDTRVARLLNDAEVTVSAGTVHVAQAQGLDPEIALSHGAVHVKVPRLSPRHHLSVQTPDAVVVVHGTRFDVTRATPDATRVVVHEGLVEVRPIGGARAPVFLRPGESLTVPSLARYHADLAAKVHGLVGASRCDDPDGALGSYLASAGPTDDTSDATYLLGFCAVQRGDLDEALRHFQRVADTSTDPTRADNALARSAQLLSSRSDPSARAAWRRYLERFPHGPHAPSARHFLHAALP